MPSSTTLLRVVSVLLLLTGVIGALGALRDPAHAARLQLLTSDELERLEADRQHLEARADFFGRVDETLAGHIDEVDAALGELHAYARVQAVAGAVITLLGCVLGLLIVVVAGASPPAALLGAFVALLFYDFRWLPGLEGGLAFLEDWLGAFFPVVLIRFAALFPRPLTAGDLRPAGSIRGGLRGWLGRAGDRRRRMLLRPTVVWSAGILFGLIISLVPRLMGPLRESLAGFSPALSRAIAGSGPSLLTALVAAVVVSWVVMVLQAMGFLRTSYRLAGEADRQRIGWIVQGMQSFAWFLLISVVLLTATDLATADDPVGGPMLSSLLANATFSIGTLLLVGGLAFATLYRGALDSRLVVRRTAIVGAMSLLAVAAFTALESIAENGLAERLGIRPLLSAWLAAGLTALIVAPLRGRLRTRIDRIIDRLLPQAATGEGAPQRDVRQREIRQGDAVVACCALVDLDTIRARDPGGAQALATLFHTAARRSAETRGGRMVKEIDGAVLLDFHDASAALHAVLALPEQYRSAAAALGMSAPPVRSGVDRGTVLVALDGDVTGEAVEGASRLVASALPGETVLSAAAADSVAPDPDFHVGAGRRAVLAERAG